MEKIELKELPIRASMWGKNRYYLECETQNIDQAYAICLHTIDYIEDERKPALSCTNCIADIKGGTCLAKKMRAEELEAGQVLYYEPPRDPSKSLPARPLATKNRATLGFGSISESLRESREKAKSASTILPKKKPAQEPLEPQNMDMSQIVNDLVKEETKKANTKSKPASTKAVEGAKPTTIQRLPGETPLAFARRKKQLLS